MRLLLFSLVAIRRRERGTIMCAPYVVYVLEVISRPAIQHDRAQNAPVPTLNCAFRALEKFASAPDPKFLIFSKRRKHRHE